MTLESIEKLRDGQVLLVWDHGHVTANELADEIEREVAEIVMDLTVKLRRARAGEEKYRNMCSSLLDTADEMHLKASSFEQMFYEKDEGLA